MKSITWGEPDSRILVVGYDLVLNRKSPLLVETPFKEEKAENYFGALYNAMVEGFFLLTFPICDFEEPIVTDKEIEQATATIIEQMRDQEPRMVIGLGELGRIVFQADYNTLEKRNNTWILVIEHPEHITKEKAKGWVDKIVEANVILTNLQDIKVEEIAPAIEIEKGDKIDIAVKESEIKHAPFVHLHMHDEYSLLDGFATVEDYARKAHERGWKHLAITNHGLVGQIPRQYTICKELGLNPIYGCEIYINDNRDAVKKKEDKPEDEDKIIKTVKVEKKQLSLFGELDEEDVLIEEEPEPIIIKKTNEEDDDEEPKEEQEDLTPKKESHNFHMVLLAKNNEGFKNLLSIVSDAWVNGFYRRPRVTHKFIEDHKEGLICGSACLGGMVSRAIMNNDIEGAKKAASYYKSIFGEDFYIELMLIDIKEQFEVNRVLVQIAQELDIPLVITNDCHYVHKDDSYYQDILLLIQNNKKLSDLENKEEHKKVFQFHTKELYFKTAEELDFTWQRWYSEIIPKDVYEQAKANTIKFAEKCKVTIDTTVKIPKFITPTEFSNSQDYLEKLAWDGLRSRLTDSEGFILPDIQEDPKVYQERLIHELDVVKRKGFTDYFLIVYDMVVYAKSHNITVGCGRGSAAGSLMCWAIGITDVNPIKFNLFFERFLNEARADLPDIDMDFEPQGREPIKDYLINKYGREHTCSIGTYGSYMTKAAIADVCRVFDVPLEMARMVTKSLPKEIDEKNKEEVEADPEMMQLLHTFKEGKFSKTLHHENEQKTLHPYDVAWKLRGKLKNLSAHAAGFIISSVNLNENLPLAKREGNVLSQWIEGKRGGELSKFGFIKWDILGLMNLTFIRETCELIEARTGKKIDLRADIDSNLNDPNVYKDLRQGKANLIFQFESPLFHKLLKDSDCDNFETLAALTALGRPGPLQSKMTEQFCLRKRGVEKFTLHPMLQQSLGHTYGVVCVAKGMKITLANNKSKNIEEIVEDTILGFDIKNNKIINNPYQKVIKTRENAKCLVIKTLISSITVTPEHEIFTLDGYKQAKDLIRGEAVAIPKPKEYYGKTDLVKEAKFVGYILANGNLHKGNWNFVSKNKCTQGNFEKSLIDLFGDSIKINYTQQVRDVLRIWCSGTISRKNPSTSLLKNYGLLQAGEYGCVGGIKSGFKYIPDIFKETTKETKIALLKAMYECDGSKEYALYSTISNQLAEDVKEYFSDIGILTFIKYGKNKCSVFILDINKFNSMFEYNLKTSYGEHLIGHRKFLDEYCKKEKISFNELGRKVGEKFIKNRIKQKRIKRESLQNFVDIIETLKLDVRFDEIKDISETTSDVYDIINTSTGNFIANNILVHNCYQEQIMQISNTVGGFSMPDTDTMRKVLSKAKGRKMGDMEEKLNKYRKQFVEHGKQFMAEKELNIMFDNFENFAAYGFNRSHAVCYTVISYRCAWLKTYYPKEYICSVLRNVPKGESGTSKKTNKYETYIKEALKLGITILKPAINKSQANFIIEDDSIRIGYANIKGIGEEDANKVIIGYPYNSFDDFLERSNLGKSKTLAFIFNGVFDEFIGRVEGTIKFYKKYCGKGKNSKPKFLQDECTKMLKDASFASEKIAKAIEKLTKDFDIGIQDIDVEKCAKYEFDEEDKEKVFEEEFGLTLQGLGAEYKDYPSIQDLIDNGGGSTVGLVKSMDRKKAAGEGKKEYYVAKMSDGLDDLPIYIWGNEYEEYRGKITRGKVLYFSVVKSGKFDSYKMVGMVNMLPPAEAKEKLKEIVDRRNACMVRVKNKEGYLANVMEADKKELWDEFSVLGFVSKINNSKICRFEIGDESGSISAFLWAREAEEFVEKVNNGDFARFKIVRRDDFMGNRSYNVMEYYVYKEKK